MNTQFQLENEQLFLGLLKKFKHKKHYRNLLLDKKS